jgi:iron-sulfur cluster insertion protein
MTITLSDSAVEKIKSLLIEENNPNLFLRISVLGGGCSGFQYQFSMDDTQQTVDQLFERDGAKILIDDISLGLLDESIVDYQSDLSASMFVIKNPNAASKCGCGNSFSI